MFSSSYVAVEGEGANYICISLYRERCFSETRYRVSVYPCSKEVINGVSFITTKLFSGYVATLYTCKRASKSAEGKALENAGPVARELFDTICSKFNLKQVGVYGIPNGFKVL